uniref:Uncharacterized protein n=1 Tax=Acrobeloides nanus TaxID=290746 RepID=A0A914CKJ2_9BILA
MDITKNLYATIAKNKPSKEVAYIPLNYPAQKELKKRLKRKKETHLVRNILIIACILIFTIVALCVVNPGIKRQLWHYFEDTDFKAEITSEIHKIEAELSKHEYFKEFQTFIQ